MQTEFVINTCVTALISIIDIFVCYSVMEKKYYPICFPRELSQTSTAHQAAQHDERRLTKYCIIFPEIIHFWSYSPLHSMLSMLISSVTVRNPDG